MDRSRERGSVLAKRGTRLVGPGPDDLARVCADSVGYLVADTQIIRENGEAIGFLGHISALDEGPQPVCGGIIQSVGLSLEDDLNNAVKDG